MSGRRPDRTAIGYKLFEEDAEGNLHPLFIGKEEIIPIGIWLPAKFLPTKGFAPRGGWHVGTIPDAPWLKGYDGSEEGYYHSRYKHGRRVWCLVEYNVTINYDDEVSELPKKSFVDKVPENGFYHFREAGKGVWHITSDMRIVREVSRTERREILDGMGYDEEAAYRKYKEAFEKRRVGKPDSAKR